MDENPLRVCFWLHFAGGKEDDGRRRRPDKQTFYLPISRYSFTIKKDVIHVEQQGQATKESDPSTQPKPEWTVKVVNKQILFYNGEDTIR